ncbi:hypothetical protein KXD40_003856 [Peronospora effusa]|nr:hypothetical protein KXD40_003856 [Peronospora effusa]
MMENPRQVTKETCPEKVVATKSMEAVFIAPFIHFEDFHLYQSLEQLKNISPDFPVSLPQ